MLAILGLTLALGALGPGQASAQSDVEAYKAHVEGGTRHFQAGRFAKARAEFEAAYAIHAEPTLLFNIASTHRRQGNDREALDYYRRFLREAPADHPQRKRAESTVTDLEAEAVLSGENVGDSGDPGSSATAPAEEEPEPMAFESEPESDDAGAATGAELSTSEQSGGTLSPGGWWKIAGAATMAGGVLFLVGAGIEGRRASSREGELEEEPGGDWTPDLMETYEEGQSAEKRAIFFGIGGAVLLGAGAALYWVGHGKASESAAGTTIGATGGPDRLGVAVSGSF